MCNLILVTLLKMRPHNSQAIGSYDDILTTVKKRKLKIIRACQYNFTRNSARREKKGPTKEALGE